MDNPDYITVSRRPDNGQYLVLRYRWNSHDDGYGIVNCQGPYPVLRALDMARRMAEEDNIRFIASGLTI